MPPELDTLLEGLAPAERAADSIEGQRLRRAVRARLLDETVPETRIDRFVVLERLGSGGMGVVFAAHDAQLDRKVAIKLVRNHDVAEHEGDQQRLIREARTLAQLSHPNVVAIYDVGLYRDQVFIAMELVQGTTLRRWAEAEPRSWPEIVRCFVQAGEGLAAAHAAGIVHRDFKPENVLVGVDGRVRVLDFGLARGHDAEASISTQPEVSIASLHLTATGKLVGTPAYMAPEQLAGVHADAKSDQFGFCVAFWELLFGERPYPAKNLVQLRHALEAGELATPADPDRAPPWLRAVIARGLATDPERRWSSMRELVLACSARPRTSRAWRAAGAVAIGGVAASLAGAALWESARRGACVHEATELTAVWSAGAADATVEAFAATDLAHARGTAERLSGVLDDYALAWRDQRVAGCIANVDGEIDDAAWQLRSECLDDGREQFATLVEVLRAPDRELVNNAVQTAYELPRPSACADDARLAANASAVNGSVDRAIAAVHRRELARVELLARTARPDGLTRALAARDAAATLGDPALVAQSELALGAVHSALGDYQAAAEAGERAYFIAAPVGADRIALLAAIDLVELVGGRLARFDEGADWSRHAEGLLPTSGTSRSWSEAALAENVAYAARERGDYPAARASYERAIALLTEVAGADHPSVGRAWVNLGAMLSMQRETDDATRALDEAERILVAAYGSESLQLATLHSARAVVAHHHGDFAASAELFERVLALREAFLEPDHPSIATALASVATARLVLGDTVVARDMLRRVVELRRRKLGSLHPLLADALSNLGNAEEHLDEYPAAIEHLTEALQIRRTVLAPTHPNTANTLVTLGDIFRHTQQPERAIATYDEVMAMGTDPSVARERGFALAGRGMAYLQLERPEPEKARADFEAALETPIVDEPDPAVLCEAYFGLTRALQATGGDATRIREVAGAGHEHCRAAGERGAIFVERLAAWARADATQ